MSEVLAGLEPQFVFKYFEAITRIPRESGNEGEITAFLENFGKSLGLETVRDAVNNIIIKKPATKGYEAAPTVILQGHVDMVCVKLDDLEFNFTKQPIPIVVDGDFIRTEGTTLGADNGIAVAMMMAVLSDKTLAHPPIVALFTTAEETGMDGVIGLEPGEVDGDILINLDSEEEGKLLTSCAGGANSVTIYRGGWEENTFTGACTIDIVGLLGGHSGAEIHKNRANALKLLGRLITRLKNGFPFGVFEVYGGEKMNAIAKRARLGIVFPKESLTDLEDIVREVEGTFKNEFSVSDPNIALQMKAVEAPKQILMYEDVEALECLLRLTHFGVYSMSADVEGLVESSNNLGVLEQVGTQFTLTNAVRSSVASLKDAMIEEMTLLAEKIGATHMRAGDYPAWPFKQDSEIRPLMQAVYLDMFGTEVRVDAIHAGLECGFLKEKIGDIDMISMGPEMHDVHTPYERLSISSTARVYGYLCRVLSEIKPSDASMA